MIVSTLASGTGLLVAGGAAAVLAARLVHAYARERHAEAERRMAREREALAAWRRFQEAEQGRSQRQMAQAAALRGQLAALRLEAATGSPVMGEAGAEGYLPAQGGGLMGEMESLLGRLPQPARESAAVAALRRQASVLDEQARGGRPPPPTAVASLRGAVGATVASLLAEAEAERAAADRLVARSERLLGEAITWRQLAGETDTLAGLRSVEADLLRLLDSGGVSAGRLDLLEAELRRLVDLARAERDEAALAAVLEERVGVHLGELGYQPLPGGERVWQVPGGERVRMAVQRGGRLAFGMEHEREVHSDRPLDAAERAFLRHQEGRWCADLGILMQRLREDGFEVSVALERDVAADAVPVVMLEDVDEWLAEGAAAPNTLERAPDDTDR